MLGKRQIRNSGVIIFIVAVITTILYIKYSQIQSEYYEPTPLATHFNGEQFVGSETCLECHADIYNSHLQTAHFKTSAEPNLQNIKGSFEEGSNTLKLKNVMFEMISDGNSFYQKGNVFGREKLESKHKIDVFVGSGVKGQSYLTWEDDNLFQLQVSYYVPNESWVNSPNYPNQYVPHLRPVSDACLKCHATFAKNDDFSGVGNRYEERRVLYGVDCERCHRPSAKHVKYQRSHPKDSTAKFMLSLGELSRKQRLDICASCHAGLRSQQVKGNPFSYLAGEDLDEYSKNFYSEKSNSELDVHGNQYGLLASSQCFKQTTMDCNTCHDPHENQRGDILHFNQKCIGCHASATINCTDEKGNTNDMNSDCISCHMPLTSSQTMKVQSFVDSLAKPVKIRTHKIAIYPPETLSVN